MLKNLSIKEIMQIKAVGVLFLASVSALARAEEPDTIATDRPDYVESSNVVGNGRFQIETSVAQERKKSYGFSQKTLMTPSLLRLGISDSVELRLETDGRIRETTISPSSGIRAVESGYADISIGAKWHMLEENGLLPSLGLLIHADLDSGSTPFRAPGKNGSLRLVSEWALPREFSLGVMPGIVTQRGEDGERFTSALFGIVLGKSWNDRFRTFFEFSAPQIARSRNGGSIAQFDIGGAYLLAESVQVDAALSRGLNSGAPDWSWTIGFSIKF
jgi:hypothetical protein